MTSARARRARPIGLGAEAAAEQHLVSKGYRLLARNYHTRDGEVDLIMERDELVAFVEVKAHKKQSVVEALESVSPAKARKIVRAAQGYAQQNGLEARILRFDIVAITLAARGALTIEHVEGAFDASAGDDPEAGFR